MGRILCVDDDINILAGFQRTLRKQFDITNALGGPAALKILEEKGPFAVIVSDMRMPGMSGLEFLALAHEKSPDSVLVILSGAADSSMAIAAANSGRISRFLVKPCPSELMAATLQSALDQYALNALPPTAAPLVPLEGAAAIAANGEQGVDPVTGLRSAGEAEIGIREAAAMAGGAHVVVFSLAKMRHTRSRFGDEITDQILRFSAQSLVPRLAVPWASQGLYRWHGEAFATIVPPHANQEEVRADAKNLAAFPLNYHFVARSRDAFVQVKLAATTVLGSDPAQLFAEMNEFVEAQKLD